MIKKGEKEFTATAYIFSDEKPKRVLLVHHIKYDKWIPPGGHVENNENPIETIIREVKEEAGIDIKKFLPKLEPNSEGVTTLSLPDKIIEGLINPYGDVPEHYHTDLGYVLNVPHQEVVHSKEESHDIGWFTKEEVKHLKTFIDVKDFILEQLSG